MSKLFRESAMFALHLALSIIATGLIKAPFTNYVGKSPAEVNHQEYFSSAIVSFALGLAISWVWSSPAAKWVWIGGAVWLGRRAVVMWFELHSSLFNTHTVAGVLFGAECGVDYPTSCLEMIN